MDPKPLRSFARSVRLGSPIVWGGVEAQILAMPVPPEEAAAMAPVRLPGGRASGALVPVLTLLPAVLGLALVVWATLAASVVPDWFAIVAGAVFVAAGAGILSPALTVHDGRRTRGSIRSVVAATALVAVALALLLLDGRTAGTWLPWLVAVVTLAGVGAIVRLSRTTPAVAGARIDPSALSPEDRWRFAARAFVLEELLRRDDVDERSVDRTAMVEMPLGGWRALDASTHA